MRKSFSSPRKVMIYRNQDGIRERGRGAFQWQTSLTSFWWAGFRENASIKRVRLLPVQQESGCAMKAKLPEVTQAFILRALWAAAPWVHTRCSEEWRHTPVSQALAAWPGCGLMDGLTPSNCRLLPKPMNSPFLPSPALLLIHQLQESQLSESHHSYSQYREGVCAVWTKETGRLPIFL